MLSEFSVLPIRNSKTLTLKTRTSRANVGRDRRKRYRTWRKKLTVRRLVKAYSQDAICFIVTIPLYYFAETKEII